MLGSGQAQVDMQKAFKIIGKGGKVVWIKTSLSWEMKKNLRVKRLLGSRQA